MNRLRWATLLLASALPAAAHGALFSDGFDLSIPLANKWTVAQQPDTSVTIFNYSNLPEAPNSGLVGGPAKQGALFRANESLGAATAINLISKASFNATHYSLQFDLYATASATALANGNGTHVAIWGVGRTNNAAVGYGNRTTAGNGLWGWLANDNGIGSEDAAVFLNTTELIDIGDTVDPGAGDLFNTAFHFDYDLFAHHSPLDEWVTVLVECDGATTTVSFNGVQFFSVNAATPAGSIAVGYADPFASISSVPFEQVAIIDNVILTPEPTTFAIALAACSAIGLAPQRRRH